MDKVILNRKLNYLREQIENTDLGIVSLFAERLRLVLQIELYKRMMGKKVCDPLIEKRRLDLVEEEAKKKNLGDDFPKIVRNSFVFLIKEYRGQEEKQRKNAGKK